MLQNQALEDFWNLEDCAVVVCPYAGAKAQKLLAIEHGRNRSRDVPERRQHYPEPILRDPIGVETLLHHRPRVALDYHRETHHQGFTNAAGPCLQ